jgi:luciferase family oxidoreductase group 1
VLDLASVYEGMSHAEAIRQTIETAQLADELGYRRFWVAEHHGMPAVASSAPAVLIGAIADATKRIRVGSGGVMLPNHSSLVIAEQFGTLVALHGDRIDLGLGRAPGTDPVASAALRRTDAEVNSQLAELLAFERGEFPASHPFSKIEPMPSDSPAGGLWMLGSTSAGASIAAQLGIPFAFAGHFAMRHAVEAIAHYKATYEPSKQHPAPYAMLAVTAVCAETDAEAERRAAPIRVAIVKNRTGKRGPIVSIEDALAYRMSPEERAIADEFFTGAVIGGPGLVAEALPRLARETQADEIMLSTLLPDLAARTESLTLIARAMF